MRYLEKFEDRTGATSYVFPNKMYEWDSAQSLRTPLSPVVGASYSYDHFGYARAPKDNANESVRFFDVQASVAALETDLDSLRSKMYEAGRGKLWTLASDGTRRWAWARITAMPSINIITGMFRHVPVSLTFERMSDWYSETLTSANSGVIAATPTTFSIVNAGNAAVKNAIILLKSQGATGFTNPVLLNQTNGYQVSTTRDGVSATDILKIDAGAMAVQYSTNNGAAYADDYALATLGAQQVGLMQLEPGSNQFRYSDGATPNLIISWTFYPAYH